MTNKMKADELSIKDGFTIRFELVSVLKLIMMTFLSSITQFASSFFRETQFDQCKT